LTALRGFDGLHATLWWLFLGEIWPLGGDAHHPWGLASGKIQIFFVQAIDGISVCGIVKIKALEKFYTV
jgi:hypothetical protein